MPSWHLITPEFPPMIGGVSEHSRVVAELATLRGLDVHVWAPSGAAALPGMQVHDTLGTFSASDLARTDSILDRCAAPRRLVLQWVPHGYGRRGLNVAFSRWVARRARAGDELDVIVHELFVAFAGGSWAQPARAIVQRYMARTILPPAHRVWLSIPGWETRLRVPWLRLAARPQVLSVPGTIPVAGDVASAAELRAALLGPANHLVGYFGAGGGYAGRALSATMDRLCRERRDVAVVCLGRGSLEVARRLGSEVPACADALSGTGTLTLAQLSRHLHACDVLLQPYQDGVSGRRTTTISALEHGIPVATTYGDLSEPFWVRSQAVETVPASDPATLASAVSRLLDPTRNAAARAGARRLYKERFQPSVALAPLFAD
jgi:hypothetical protein